jgi:hypothetical protein
MKDYTLAGLLILGALHALIAIAQSDSEKTGQATDSITITEPGIIPLGQLFKMADEVAVVRVISGDTENYKTAVYKAVVVTSFKGTTSGQTIYVGPFIGQRLGWEYVVFLRSKKEPAVPKTTPKASFGTVKYLEVFNQGNSEMETSYECVFDGKDTVHQCDYGVRVCTNYTVLPEHTPPVSVDGRICSVWMQVGAQIEVHFDTDELADQAGALQVPASARW